MRFLPLLFASVLAACGGSDDSGSSSVDSGVDSIAGDTSIVDAPKDTGVADAPKDTTTPTDTATSDTSSGDTATSDTATDDAPVCDASIDCPSTDTIVLDVPLDVPEGGLEAGATCTTDLECASGLKCCYPCGIPGCSNACIPPDPGGTCPHFP